jgi:DoxX
MGRKLHRADGTRRAPVAFMVGLLYMEHGFAKILDFSHQSTHVSYAPFTLNPGLQELLEFVGGLLLVLGSFTRTITSVLAGNMAVASREASSRCSTAESWQSSTVSSFSIFGWPAVGASPPAAPAPADYGGSSQSAPRLCLCRCPCRADHIGRQNT